MSERQRDGHLFRSHAHEELPGTVNVQALAGDDTGYGQALFPVPAKETHDPLQWPKWKKNAVLIICSLYSFFCNSTLIGSSVYISIYADTFHVSPTKASQTSSYPTLAFGCGCIILIPMYMKFGRRPTMLFSQLLYTFATLGCAEARTFSGFMAARCIHAAGSGVCEALPVQCVYDVFFLHERGKRISYYTAALALGSIGPLPAGYLLAAGYSYKLFFYIEFAIGMVLLIATFFLVPETAYKRQVTVSRVDVDNNITEGELEKGGSVPSSRHTEPESVQVDVKGTPIKTQRGSYLASLSPFSGIDHDVHFFKMIARSFTYFFVPHVLWVITSFGIYIGCAALAFNYTFPGLIVAPPYNWNPINSGLIAVAFVIGYGLALPFSSTSDRLAAYLTRRNNNIRESEMRLGVMLPAAIIGPAGLVVYGLTAQYKLQWVGYFAGVAMVDWSALFFFTITLAYCLDSYTGEMGEFLIAMQVGKNSISFGMGYALLNWVLETGYAAVIAGAFGGIMLANNIFLGVFIWKGKSIRIFWNDTWLAKFHKSEA